MRWMTGQEVMRMAVAGSSQDWGTKEWPAML